MNAEIIAVGSELLTPQRIDTNSLYLTSHLNGLGVEVTGKAVVGDDRARLAVAVRGAISRAELVILTGGLGPTEDDVTRDAVAEALGRPLVFRQDLCDVIEQRFRQMDRQMAEINRRQAFVVSGGEALPNGRGTAPGQWVPHAPGKAVILLPGPPRELQPMFESECLSRLRAMLPAQVIRVLQFRVACMPESDLDQLISPVYTRYSNPSVTVLAAIGDIQIHLRARCDTAEEADALLAEVGGQIEELLGDRIYSRNGELLEAVVGQMLRERQATLAVAESCTGGMLGQRITSVAGSSDYFVGGFLAYTAPMKTALLGVSPEVIAAHTVVSNQVALRMAEGARERTSAVYALSVTGEAGPASGSGQEPGTVFIGLVGPDGAEAKLHRFYGDRNRVRQLATQTALDTLRRALIASP